MTEVHRLEELRRLMPPTTESDTSVDWTRMAETWGNRFPEDYRQFIALYGSGAIENYLVVQDPEPKGERAPEATGGMLHETANATLVWTKVPKSPELADAHPTLIAWGADASSDILCWDASGDDPETWPVLVHNRGDNLWRRYDCGMVEFLVRVLRADFEECPLGDLSLWGKDGLTFLTWREEQRRIKAGLDPWTGEPDPFAGMFGD
ncbi:SMI1/KNR4 family protein [Streptomyces tanashiensis]|uniref:SMI1/KNR4 family protein n=1 Tax=Streptomyces tanashiensis TaxID=67367 RepID=UPI0036DFD804